ncbi:hypothetical protein BGP76_14605 [Reichenbachiella sp. MSK19-1]|nr:hypothetical protein BGP76_14605 [Reichenbachiella sp. MSK19-1]
MLSLSLNIVLLGVTLFCIWMQTRKRLMAYAVFVYCGFLVAIYVLFWGTQGGVYGAFSTAYFTILVMLIAVLPRVYKIPAAVILCLLTLVLSTYYNKPIEEAELTSISMYMDFLINVVFVAICIVYVKKDMEQERITYYQYNGQIDRLTQELNDKRKMLLEQRKHIETTKNNLESIIEAKTLELKKKNQTLYDYAYDNAHILRAPLSNILGLIAILEKEMGTSTDLTNDLEQLKALANSLDDLVKEVNVILR